LYDDGIQVIGVPKTIDGDIQVRDDDGNVCCARCHSAFTQQPARSPTPSPAFATTRAPTSNIITSARSWGGGQPLALEVAAGTPTTVIGEDLVDFVDEERLERARRDKTTDRTACGMTLRHLSRMICEDRAGAAAGKNYGVSSSGGGSGVHQRGGKVFIMKPNTIIAEYNRTHDREFHRVSAAGG
jgi:pyrophosphate--fructose-6-phosphate 1-phosphotransferase